MTEYELKLPGALLSSLMSERDGLARLVEALLNQLLERQTVEQLGALCYERSEERTAESLDFFCRRPLDGNS